MDQPQFLMIVRHGQTERFRLLEKSFAGEPVRIIWDRRTEERRSQHQPVAIDRRRSKRRQPSVVWNTLDFAVARAPSAAASGSETPRGASDL